MAESDPELGNRVQRHLVKLGIETPMIMNVHPSCEMPERDKQLAIQNYFKKIMEVIGLDLRNDSLRDTPKRVAKMFTKEIFVGLDYKNFPACTVTNNVGYNQVLSEEKIAVKSLCEHHFVAIDGLATVAYIPKKKMIGLSKLNRVVTFFSRRPQVQERLTEQIHAALCLILETKDVAVLIRAEHLCVRHRGVEDSNSMTTTSKLTGAFLKNSETRNEFMLLAKG